MSEEKAARGFNESSEELQEEIGTQLGSLSVRFYELRIQMDALEEQRKVLNKEKDRIDAEISEIMETEGLEKFSSEAGSHTLFSEVYPGIKDFDAFTDWVFKTGSTEFMQKRVNAAPVREMLKETGECPPGIDVHTETRTRTRVNPSWKSAHQSK